MLLCSSLLQMCVQSLKLILSAIFVLELVKCSPPRNFSLSKFLQLWKLQHQIYFKHIFWSNCNLSDFFWNLWRQTNWYLSKKVNIWAPSGYFPFFHFIFLLKWHKQEIFNRRHQKDQKQSPQPATLLKKRLCHRYVPVNLAKFLRTSFLTEHLQWLLLKNEKLRSRTQCREIWKFDYQCLVVKFPIQT